MIELQFYAGMTEPKRLRSLVQEFVQVVQEHDLMTFDRRVYVEMMPTPFVCRSLGITFLPQAGCPDYHVQVASVDWDLKAWSRARLKQLQLDPGEGSWRARCLRTTAHELAHATGVMQEAATWKRADAVIRAATALSARLRRELRA